MSIIRTVAAFCLLILICNATINAQQCNLNSQGSFCTSLQLSIDCQDATQIQWFRNDELIPGWSDSSIELRDITDEQGDYHAEYFLNGVAGATTAVQVRNIFYETDLGDMFICKGDTLLIPNFPPLAHSGQYQTRTTAQDGCDSLIFFTLSALPETITNLGTQYICNSEVFTYGGIEYNQPGEYDVFIGSTIYGCDSTVTFQVVKDSAIRVDLPVIKLCYGDSIIIDGETYNEDTLFTKTILSPTTGCDSITSYSIRVQPEIITNLGQKQICNGEVFNYRGIEYNQPGEYQINISSTTIHACDTTVIFQVVKDSAIRVALPIIELCFGDSIIIDGQIYYDDAQIEKNAISTTTGCDSITISTIRVLPENITDLGNIFACEGDTLFIRNFPPITKTSRHREKNTTQDGCDSIIIFETTFLPETLTNLGLQYICNGEVFTYRGIEYNQPGEYDVFIGSTIHGCDSTVTFQVVKDSAIRIDLPIIEFCLGDSLFLDGEIYYEDAQFEKNLTSTITGCDSIVLVNIKTIDCGPNNCTISIPDPNFLNALIKDRVDLSGDGTISCGEAYVVENLNILQSEIRDLTGIEYFTQLKELDCRLNQLTDLDINANTQLVELECSWNQLTYLDLSSNALLVKLDCHNNQLTNLDLSTNTQLVELDCGRNQLTNLDLSNNKQLQLIECHNNQLQSLTLTNNSLLTEVYCYGNDLTTLDLSTCTQLEELDCEENNLQSLYLKNGSIEEFLYLEDNPELNFICADEEQIEMINEELSDWDIEDCTVTSFCSFDTDTTRFLLKGKLYYTSNLPCDIRYPGPMSFLIDNGQTTEEYLIHNSSEYSLDLPKGSYTITPSVENPEKFKIFPPTITVTEEDTIDLNICVVPQEEFADLEVNIVEKERPFPGEEITYLITVKNKGSLPLSAAVIFFYDEQVLDLDQVMPTPNLQAPGRLEWYILNINPLKVRTYEVTFDANTPMDNPPLNGGDFLKFECIVNHNEDDYTPTDNSFSLCSEVVNSFDPNNKICLEGRTLSPDLIGEYVHYQINFENLGTAAARRINVIDTIDTSVFDISSLIVLESSHKVETSITEGNIVSFIFEDIYLDFADETNDGYVMFKIKTLDHLVLGDVIENKANIYFDFNFPIVTNVASTLIQEQTLAINNNKVSKEFDIIPNPAANQFRIHTSRSNELESYQIWAPTGQLIQEGLLDPEQLISTAQLSEGVYIILVKDKSGLTSTKRLAVAR